MQQQHGGGGNLKISELLRSNNKAGGNKDSRSEKSTGGFHRKQSHSKIQAKKIVHEDIVWDEDESEGRNQPSISAETNSINRSKIPPSKAPQSNHASLAYSMGRPSHSSLSTYNQQD